MAPRKGSRKGKNVSSAAQVQDHNVPTEEEFVKMKMWASFIISDAEKNTYRFMRGQAATVLPHDCPPGTLIPEYAYWVVRIREIRGVLHEDDGTNDVWARVQWYYSPKDAASVIKSFDTEACSPYERIFSDHFDIVSSEAFNEIIDVHELNDSDINQKFIDPDSFYSRYSIERDTRRIKPKPGADGCTCHKPYNYHDDTTVMHFCPRPSCRKWYHQSCLITTKSKAPKPKNREQDLLANSPFDDKLLSLSEFCPPPTKRRKSKRTPGKAAVKGEDGEDDQVLLEALSALPQDLVRVAEQPIVRGSLYVAGGVSGNVRPVVQARQLVYDALGGEELPDDWEERVLGQITAITLEDAVVRVKGKRSLPPLSCPECLSAI